jgi:hypothetical protein
MLARVPRLEPDLVLDRIPQPLLAAEIPLSRLHAYVAKED